MTLALSTERPDPNVCPIADAEIVTVTESSPQDLQAVYDREVDIEAETTSNPVNTACPYPPDVNPDPPEPPPVDPEPEPDPQPETIQVTVTAGSGNICHNATELPELTQSVSPEIPGGSIGSPTVPSWSPGTHNPGDTFPVIPGTWTPPDDGKIYEVTYVNGTLTVIHCAEDIAISVTADNVAICVFSEGETTPLDLTQTVNPPEYADYFSAPSVDWDGSTGQFIITPGTLISNPNDVDNFIVTPHNGTLTVTHCDPEYNYLCEAGTVAASPGSNDVLVNNDNKCYKTEARYVRVRTQSDTAFSWQSPVWAHLAVAFKLEYLSSGTDISNGREFNFDVYNGNTLIEFQHNVTVSSSTVTTIVFVNALIDIGNETAQKIFEAYRDGEDWSTSKQFEIRISEVDNRPQGDTRKLFQKTINYTLNYKKCPICKSLHGPYCTHDWTTHDNPSDLWAGTATVE